MKWIKASERKSEHLRRVCCRRGITHFDAVYDKSTDCYVKHNGMDVGFKMPLSEIEWLDESELSIKDLEEAAEEYAYNFYDKSTGSGQYKWLTAKEDFMAGAEYVKNNDLKKMNDCSSR